MTHARDLVAAAIAPWLTASALASVTLAADDAPSDPPWESPATLSYVWNGDGTSKGVVDAVLRYKNSDVSSSQAKATKSNYALGVYVHRDTDSGAPRNDRGVQASYGQLIVRDGSNSGGVRSLSWTAKLSLGKALQAYKDANDVELHSDRTKDRQSLQLAGYYQPALTGAPPRPGSNDRPPLIMFFDGSIGAYSDNSHGGSGKGTGRLTGAMVGLSANFAPLGIDPAFNQIGSLGFVPTVRLAAQVQRDMAASGDRPKDTYKLFTVAISLAFGKLQSGGGLVPSLNLVRTVGADLLTGRAKTSTTELSLGLTF